MVLTKSELEVMNVIWEAGRPLSRNDILTLSTEKTWKDSSIHILLNGLLEKGAIKEDGFVRSGKVWGRLYAAELGMEKYYVEEVFGGKEKQFLPTLFGALLESPGITQEDLGKLQQQLDKRKAELAG